MLREREISTIEKTNKDLQDENGLTALHNIAAYFVREKAVNVFLRFMAKINAKTFIGNFTALHFAVLNGHVNIVKALLMEHADHLITTKDGYTAMDFTQSKSKIEKLLQFAQKYVQN